MSSENLGNWRNEILDLLEGDVAVPQSETVEPTERASDRIEVLAFSLGEEIFGVDIRSVSEILRHRQVTRLPRVPEYVTGVISLRGSIFPVIDTALRIGLEKREESEFTRVVVINDDEEQMGFSVDNVIGVVRFSEEELKAVEFASNVDTEFLLGIGYDTRQRLIALLSAQRLCDFSLEEDL